MKVNSVNLNLQNLQYPLHTEKQSTKTQATYDNSGKLFNDLNSIAILNKTNLTPINFQGKSKELSDFEINYSLDELRDRTSSAKLAKFVMVSPEDDVYKNLADGDKEALKHLVQASRILNDVFLMQDNPHNMEVREKLEMAANKGDEKAELSLRLFDAQQGINAKDNSSKPVQLIKDYPKQEGKGFYPEDLSKEEFHNILISMLNNGEDEEVKKILNQRSMVERDGDKLKATDYTEFFDYEFKSAAYELLEAAKTSTNEDFNKFLFLQADALINDNPQIDANADKLWAKLQYTPLEFTLTRESYDDRMTPSVNENKELKALLEAHDIVPYAKDSFGVRVGIVDKEGTDYLLKIKEYLPLMADNMPYNDEYSQTLANKKDSKQTMVDVNIVDVSGHNRAYRGGIGVASNLPNNDKLAVKQGGGFRNVYHKQIRESRYGSNTMARLDAILDDSQHQYYDSKSLHDFTILHENVHSLGPKKGSEKLGVLKNTIEENKADMGAITMLEPLVEAGFYTKEKAMNIITANLVAYVPKGPDFENAHRRRNIMQYNYLIQNGAIDVSDNGKMTINYEKVIPTARKMLSEIIRIQIDGDMQKAQEYVDKYSVWSKELDLMSKKINAIDTIQNAEVQTPLADAIMAEEI